MKKLIPLICLLASGYANAATAYFTGVQEMVQTVTYQMGWRCQYSYAGQIFWVVFVGSCPSSIEVH